jgi:Protein of unknown function (DUF1236)
MRKARLLSTVAATLLLTVGIASAQNTNMKKDEAPTQAPAAQQKAPAEKVAPTMKPGEQKAGVQQKAPETTGQAPKASDADKPRASDKGAMDKDKGAMDKGAVDKKMDKGAAAKSPSDANGSADAKIKANEKASENAGAKEAAPGSAKPAGTAGAGATTGQGAAAGSAKLTTEQHAKITTIIKQQKVEPAHLNVSVSVGTRVPDSVRFYPLPVEVIVVYPEWRGYDYILVGDQILVIDPRSHEIVAVLDA